MKAAYILLTFIIGALIGFVLRNVCVSISFLIFVIVFRFAISIIQRNPLRLSLCNKLLTLWVGMVSMCLGTIDTTLHPASEFIPEENTRYLLEGEILNRRTLASGENYLLSIISINGIKEKGRVRVYAPADAVFEPGEYISFRANMTMNETHEFAERQYTAFIQKSSDITILNKHNYLTAFFFRLREHINIAIDRTGLNTETTALMRALILADRTSVGKQQIENFKNGGSIHILAVSGMHIGIIAIILMQLTLPLTLVVGRRMRYIIIVCGVWVFVMLTGAPLSAVRSALMLSIAVLAWILERRRNMFSAVCFATLFILLINPQAMFDIGLQLSFASVASITLLVEQLNPIDKRLHAKVYKICGVVITTLVATGATWILSGYYFGNVPLRFLPSNLLILPLLPFYMMMMLLYLFLTACGLEIAWLGGLIEKVPEWLYAILDKITTPSLAVEINLISVTFWFLAMALLAASVNINRQLYIRSYSGAKDEIDTLQTNRYMKQKRLLFTASSLFVLLSIISLLF